MIATGVNSEIGKIGQSLATLETEPPRLQVQTRRVVRLFAVFGGGVSLLGKQPVALTGFDTSEHLVVGGLYRLEGAWVGALFFVVVNNYSQQISFIGPRFHTLIGAIFLALLKPGVRGGSLAGSLAYRDNVLGPSRPFFSTYLESIWLLQLCVALDMLEGSGGSAPAQGICKIPNSFDGAVHPHEHGCANAGPSLFLGDSLLLCAGGHVRVGVFQRLTGSLVRPPRGSPFGSNRR